VNTILCADPVNSSTFPLNTDTCAKGRPILVLWESCHRSEDEFGNQFMSQGNTPNVYRYTGQQSDADSGLYYLRARYYEPSTGRFITQDPKKGDIKDPVTMNPYIYCRNNPLKFTDPSGEDFKKSIVCYKGQKIITILGHMGFYVRNESDKEKVRKLLDGIQDYFSKEVASGGMNVSLYIDVKFEIDKDVLFTGDYKSNIITIRPGRSSASGVDIDDQYAFETMLHEIAHNMGLYQGAGNDKYEQQIYKDFKQQYGDAAYNMPIFYGSDVMLSVQTGARLVQSDIDDMINRMP